MARFGDKLMSPWGRTAVLRVELDDARGVLLQRGDDVWRLDTVDGGKKRRWL